MVANAAQPSSGLYNFDPALSDLTLEAFARVGIRAASLTVEHMQQARFSSNLLLSDWANRQVNLWEQLLIQVPLIQGTQQYTLPQNIVTIVDAYTRQYQVGNPVNIAVSLTTSAGSPTVTINWAGHGLSAGQWMAAVVQIAVGGLIIYGFYQVVSVTSPNAFTITATSNATGNVTGGGVVPLFTTAGGSPTVTVTLLAHGLTAGNTFSVPVSTVVGGITLSGSYTVTAYVDANNFTITAANNASGVAAVYENSGTAQYESQDQNSPPQDRVMTPISRTDYAAQPDKYMQAFPSTYFFLRTITPSIFLWPVADGYGPYVLNIWVVTQMQDATMPGGVTLDIPYRFDDAFAAGLAARLARKYAPAIANDLRAEAEDTFMRAAVQDTEPGVNWYIQPQTNRYYR